MSSIYYMNWLTPLTPVVLVSVLVAIVLIGDALWFVTDRRPGAERRRSCASLSYPRLWWCLAPGIVSAVWWPWPSSAADAIVVPLGLVVFGAGFALAVWAKLFMGERWNMPARLGAGQDRLLVGGPFAITRNPIYLGVTLMAAGFCLATRSYALVMVIPLFMSLRASAIAEERILERHFGRDFTSYTHVVPRFLGRPRTAAAVGVICAPKRRRTHGRRM